MIDPSAALGVTVGLRSVGMTPAKGVRGQARGGGLRSGRGGRGKKMA